MKTKSKPTIIVVVALLLILVLSLLLAYKSGSNDPVTVSFKQIYPAAIVGSNIISVYDWENFNRIARNLDPMISPQIAASALITQAKQRQLAEDLMMNATPAQIDAEYRYLTLGKETELQELINNNYFGRPEFFSKFLVWPEFTDSFLRFKYNSDSALNAGAYQEVQSLLTRLSNGEKFEDLAKSESADKQTGQFGGDLGFVSKGEILPELEGQVLVAEIGKVIQQIIPSRVGLHIIEVVEIGQNMWHVKHILIQTTGYEVWLKTQLDKISVWQIIKP